MYLRKLAFGLICMCESDVLILDGGSIRFWPEIPTRMNFLSINSENSGPCCVIIGSLEFSTLKFSSCNWPWWIWHVFNIRNISFSIWTKVETNITNIIWRSIWCGWFSINNIGSFWRVVTDQCTDNSWWFCQIV